MRGEVYWVAFGPSVGGEIQKTRPAIVISNDEANARPNRVLVVPLTSNVERVFDGEALISLNGRSHKAMASQLMTVSKLRIGDRFGVLSAEDLWQVEEAVVFQIGLTT